MACGGLNIAHVPQGWIGGLLGTHTHRQVIEVVEFAMIGEGLVAQTLTYDRQRLEVTRIIHLDVGVLAPEVGFQDPATSYTNLHAPATEVVQHADLFNETHRVVQRQNIDTRPEPQTLGALRDRGQEDILRRRQAVHRRGVVLCQVVGIKPSRIQPLNLDEPLGIDVLEVETGDRFNVVEDTELQRHSGPPENYAVVAATCTGTYRAMKKTMASATAALNCGSWSKKWSCPAYNCRSTG